MTATEKTTKRRIVVVAIGAAWLVGISALVTLVDGFLGNVPIARAVLGGLLVSIAVGRAGVLWDDDDPDGDSYKKPALLALGGAGRSASIALLTIALSIAFGWASIGPGHPALALLVGVLVALGGAVRDELLLRALPLHFARRAGLVGAGVGTGPVSIATPTELSVVAFSALLSVAPLVLAPRSTGTALVLAAAIAFLHAAYQLRTRSVWAPVASSFILRLALGPTLQTGLLRIEWKVGELTLGSLAEGHAVWIFAVLAVGVAAFGLPRRPLPPPDPLSVEPAARRRPGPRRSPRTPRRPPQATPTSEPRPEPAESQREPPEPERLP